MSSFEQMMEGIDWTVPADELPIFLRGPKGVRVNPIAGETFRSQLINRTAETFKENALGTDIARPLDAELQLKVGNGLIALLDSPTPMLRLGGLVALRGNGPMELYDVDSASGSEIANFDGEQTLFGMVTSAGHGGYPVYNPNIAPEDLIDDEDNYIGPTAHGPLLALTKVVISSLDDPDSPLDDFSCAIVPIAAPNFNWYKVA